MERTDNQISFDQMKGAIGSLLYLWSNIEKALNASLIELNSGKLPAIGISGKLDLWSKLVMTNTDGRPLQRELCQRILTHLRNALIVRNLVCHGLVGISGGSVGGESMACLTVELDDSRRILTWVELQEMFSWMSTTNWKITALTAATMERKPALATKKLPNMENFPV